MFCTKADISWNTRSSSFVIMLGFSWSWGRPQPWSKLYNLSALFLASEAARMWHLHIWQGIVRLTYTGHSNNSVFLFVFSAMSNTANWLLAVSGTKACQTISGLVKTRGHLVMLRHAIGWNLRVCLLWLTGVESSIIFRLSQNRY